MQWMYYHKDIGKQINVFLFGGIAFVVLYAIFDHIEKYFAYLSFFKLVSLFCAVYLLAASLLFTKKWIDKKYK